MSESQDIERWKQQQKQLGARIARASAIAAERERRVEFRKHAVTGRVVLEAAAAGEFDQGILNALLDAHLVRNFERKLFGLRPIEQPQQD